MRTANGDLRSTRTLRPRPLVKNTILLTSGFARPFARRIVIETRALPPGGVHFTPASSDTWPSLGAGGAGAGVGAAAGGTGSAIGPKSTQPDQPRLAFQSL